MTSFFNYSFLSKGSIMKFGFGLTELKMAVWKMLGLGQDGILTIFTKCRSVSLRTVSRSRIIEELMGYPRKPVKPANPFLKFLSAARQKYVDELGFKCTKDKMKELSDKWNKMPQSEKEKYIREFEEEMVQYKEKLEAYNSSLTKVQKEELMKLKSDIQNCKRQVGPTLPKVLMQKSLKKPTVPRSTFLRFFQELNHNKGAPYKEHLRAVAECWKNLSENEKMKYKYEYEKEKQEYQKNLEKWELKMIQEGKMNVIRLKTLKELIRVS